MEEITPRKCVGCEQKTVKHAYNLLCGKCATKKNVCAKCFKPVEMEETLAVQDITDQTQDIKALLRTLPERKRRTLIRHMNKLEVDQNKVSPEAMAHLEDILSRMDKVSLGSDDLEESDAEEHENFYENREDTLRDLENPIEEENDDDDDPILAEDPPLTNENPAYHQVPQVPFPSTSQAR
ncbi:hypothetical protein K1T71_003271 [Dendrolimus kikuchii]|uniref:Uncharacterized protein n=1 Tax=Dendrolimus kikuchii TaxID=765133 RepID=A0ACC1DC06_9NEOP|nr:hypothetical protein K1T71_003271 [Dendrolimus kikuchii]